MKVVTVEQMRELERRAVRSSAMSAGAKAVYMVDEATEAGFEFNGDGDNNDAIVAVFDFRTRLEAFAITPGGLYPVAPRAVLERRPRNKGILVTVRKRRHREGLLDQ